MFDRRVHRFIVVLVAAALALASVGPAAAAEAAARSPQPPPVTIDRSVFNQVAPLLGDSPFVDYGRTIWVRPTAAAAAAIRAAGVPFRAYPEANVVDVASGPFDPLASVPSAPPALRDPGLRGFGLELVQLTGPIHDEWISLVESAGSVRIVQVHGGNALLVWADAAARSALRSLAGGPAVRWAGPYEPLFKIAGEGLLEAPAGTLVDVTVQVLDHRGAGATLDALGAVAAAWISRPATPAGPYRNASLTVDAADLPRIARLADVITIEPWIAPEKHGEIQAQIMAGNLNGTGTAPSGPGYLTWLSALGFSTTPGDYPIVTVVDDGVDEGDTTPLHADFYEGGSTANASRLVTNFDCTADNDPHGLDGHGNINAGIVGGYNVGTGSAYEDASGFNYGVGLNPWTRLGNTRVFNDAGSFDAAACANDYSGIIERTWNQGARISTNSWGSNAGGAYTSSSQAYDIGTRDAVSGTAGNQELSHVFSAGNSGSGANTIGAPGTGKNIVSIGAAENVNQFGTDGCGITNAGADNAMDIIGFSSRGPTDDGRVKPDMTAPGTHIQGPASQEPGYTGASVCDQYRPAGQTLYAASSGTSHSAPAVAGVASLAYHAMERFAGWLGAAPSPAMVKAFLTTHTRRLTGVSGGGNLPTNAQGYGETTLADAFDTTVSRVFVDQSQIFGSTADSLVRTLTVDDVTKPVRIMAAWTDAPGAVGCSATCLVNDLDLTVAHGGSTYLGNVFSGDASTTGGAADRKNNSEAVFLPAGTTGSFTVTIAPFAIAGDGVPGNADTSDQDVALYVFNASASAVAAGVTVTPTSGLVTTEGGATDTFTVVLDSEPSADVTIGLSSSDTTEGTVSPASMTFTSSNWATPQTATVTGVDDAVVDGAVAYAIVTAAAVSADGAYNGLDPADVSATNTDNDVAPPSCGDEGCDEGGTPSIIVSPTSGLTTTEAGGTATFAMRLGAAPSADVTVGLSSSDTTEGTVSPASVTFTTSNWSTNRTITVTGVDDAIVDGSVAYVIVTAPATSADPAYDGMDASNVSVVNQDDDGACVGAAGDDDGGGGGGGGGCGEEGTPGFQLSSTRVLTTSESGATDSFSMRLTSAPSSDVTVGISSSDLTEGTVSPSSLTFTSATWSAWQTVTVTGVDDAAVDGTVAYTVVTGAASSADPAYSGLNPPDVAARNLDDESGGGDEDAALAMCRSATPTIVGTSGDDRLVGTAGPDVIVGLGGDDRIWGLGGDDIICGGDGDDRIVGGDGDDRIYGDAGDDVAYGQAGADVIYAGDGADRVAGGGGRDALVGGAGDDVIVARGGGNRVWGQAGDDRIDARSGGGDRIVGGPGADRAWTRRADRVSGVERHSRR